MRIAKSWLEELTLPKLHQLATAIGAPCSGTKGARIEGIQQALTEVEHHASKKQHVSLVSIDMGIRNLAFAHITAPVQPNKYKGYSRYDTPILNAWQRMSIAESDLESKSFNVKAAATSSTANTGEETGLLVAAKESFEPKDYAKYAYNYCDYMLRTFKPTHIVIERQRFRSGGQAAVLEWTLRVGVFEGMLYSAFETLMRERELKLRLTPMQPPRVNRYWLGTKPDAENNSTAKLTGREVKQAKIDLVCSMLETKSLELGIGTGATSLAANFVLRCRKAPDGAGRRSSTSDVTKLDDLADSLLQGLAFMQWNNNRARVAELGQDAVDMKTGNIRVA